MAIPSSKTETYERSITKIFGFDRRKYITKDVCIPEPYGCDGPATEFDDMASRQEYAISGLCQKCQDKTFGISDAD